MLRKRNSEKYIYSVFLEAEVHYTFYVIKYFYGKTVYNYISYSILLLLKWVLHFHFLSDPASYVAGLALVFGMEGGDVSECSICYL